MRVMKERKPERIRNGKPIYNPGFVDCYQKPWFIRFGGMAKYYGRFCEEGYPGNIRLEFWPLRKLIDRIENVDPDIKQEIMTMIEELEDAHREEVYSHIRSLPSAD